MRCAQRGCALPPDATTTDGAMCPVCNNPLIVVMEVGDEDASRENFLRASLASSDPQGHLQAQADAEVSQEQPPVIGADGLPIPATA